MGMVLKRLWIYSVWKCAKRTGEESVVFWFEKRKHATEWAAAHETAQFKYKVRRQWYPDLI